MKSTLALALIVVMFAACDSANSQHPSVKYEEKKRSLEEMEKDTPLKFLKVKGDLHTNLVNQTVVAGEITNHATFASYKNLQLQIVFKDKEGSTIDKHKELLEDVIGPNATQDFKVKVGHVKGANSVVVDIVSAAVDK